MNACSWAIHKQMLLEPDNLFVTKCLAKSCSWRDANFWCFPLLFTPPGLIRNERLGTAKLPEPHLFQLVYFPHHKANRYQPQPQPHGFPWNVTILDSSLFPLSPPSKMLPNTRSKNTCEWRVSPGIADDISMLLCERKADTRKCLLKNSLPIAHIDADYITKWWKPLLNVVPNSMYLLLIPFNLQHFQATFQNSWRV